MDVRGLLTEGFGRIAELYPAIAGIGYGHTSEQVDAIRIQDVELLTAYHHEVTLATARYLGGVDEKELEREVDQSWDPPVTAGVRLISIQGDCLQHLGQAAYVKGLL